MCTSSTSARSLSSRGTPVAVLEAFPGMALVKATLRRYQGDEIPALMCATAPPCIGCTPTGTLILFKRREGLIQAGYFTERDYRRGGDGLHAAHDSEVIGLLQTPPLEGTLFLKSIEDGALAVAVTLPGAPIDPALLTTAARALSDALSLQELNELLAAPFAPPPAGRSEGFALEPIAA